MTDKELIAKLNSLKNIVPDSNWKTSNRDLLLSQISNSGARELSVWKVFIINFSSLAKAVSKPAFAFGVFVLVLITGSLFSHQVFGGAKPNDSLYIARIISEKVKLNTIFNTEARNKLAVQFATEHAKEISAMLANPEFNNDANQDQVAKLNASFNQEIDNVKSHISYLSAKTAKTDAKVEKIIDNNLNNVNDKIILEATGTGTVLIASELKDKAGLQLFENTDSMPALNVASTTARPILASSTDTADATAAPFSTDSVLDEAKQLYEEAKQLSENKNYDEVANKLDEATNKLKEVDE